MEKLIKIYLVTIVDAYNGQIQILFFPIIIKISRTICLIETLQGIIYICNYLRDWFSERVLWIYYSVSVSLLCRGKIVVSMSLTSLFFFYIKYSKSRYWMECYPIIPKLAICCTHVYNLSLVCSIHLLYIPAKSFLPWKPKEATKSTVKFHKPIMSHWRI